MATRSSRATTCWPPALRRRVGVPPVLQAVQRRPGQGVGGADVGATARAVSVGAPAHSRVAYPAAELSNGGALRARVRAGSRARTLQSSAEAKHLFHPRARHIRPASRYLP